MSLQVFCFLLLTSLPFYNTFLKIDPYLLVLLFCCFFTTSLCKKKPYCPNNVIRLPFCRLSSSPPLFSFALFIFHHEILVKT
ncbi:hypothetical protein L6452_21544 [Arctium lappa]|uniref:Uncharacterized protein n=1 Tax=Arctium lappa TaxID=4217 RepID=A0ACB9AWQ7_ARCLA|nr:hypothetical protein L6452_21544 [Arctium lappa]